MALKKVLRSGVAAACIASVVAPAGLAAPAAKAVAQRGGVDVRVATTETFSRIEVTGGGKLRREGRTVVLTNAPDNDPEVARLLTSPPKWIKSAVKLPVAGRRQIVVTLADDADVTIGQADGAAYANFFEAPPPAPEAAPQEVAVAEPEPSRPSPLPPGGVVRMASRVANGQTQLSFTWANPAGAAVFRRGDAIWVVFDAPASLDVSSAPKGVRPLRSLQAFKGADHAALRIDADPNAPIFVSSQGSTWTISLGPGPQAQPSIVRVGRDAAGGPATLKAPVAGATRIVNLPDPVVGDTLTVVTALGPPKGVPSRRDFVDAALLPSIQGLAIEPLTDNLTVQRDGELVRISRAEGLTLSPSWAVREREDTQLGTPQPAPMPAIIPAEWANLGSVGFQRRYDSLLSAATVEGGNKDREAPVAARMGLARFLVGSELSFEAIGVLNALAREHPEMLDDPEFRALRGVARTLARRYAEADADFSSPTLSTDPSTALWRAYVNTQIAQHAEARAQFAKGVEAYGLMPPLWRARFARADAQAALAQGDLVAADTRIRMALEEKVSSEEQLRSRLIQARIIELQGSQDRALKIYKAIATAPIDSIAAPAVLRATQIRLQLAQITPLQAAGVYDGLRYRWRGDATELETIRALGQLYLAQGRYREALEALRSAGVRLPDLPEAQQLQADLNAAFRGLFLDGLADGLEPLQALALFFDFRELAPIGADGDLMVRKIVRRLVDVDLLPQAAELLKYQAENRLDGVPRAQVSTDLAVIYLMDRKPEQALQAINSSRTTVLPSALNAERRLIEARAWTALGRYDSALEILGADASKDGTELRSEITWKQKNWASAGPLFEKSLGDRWKNPTQLSSDEEGRLLRAGVAYSLAGDEAALGRLQQRYQSFYEKANNPDALRIALSGVPSGRMSVADFSRVSADNEAFAGWVEKMKGRFKTRAAPGAAKPVAPARQAEAAPPAAKG
ncbi:MAG: endoglucanase [Phenylobacterium sp. RIFCSPHIGHO2_01_FULL_69_31]|uniref:tetratricopeptide repeat protein n=1 Tax=Phenylobacterium sp. RIFCSPHIGHO2_01_FULL_69_31 TaxID=1801944 RepID=UPI0008B0D516|nr:tetratricopeptide repeat protein [Phenylobacterium sp. RIFCSPHIGHO2_01_FULL_69_31]OHB28602.1 MAG: endoglucanase [Phenylobacterium sp. RIFCSPHIGHO2_01_FULL_69_31]